MNHFSRSLNRQQGMTLLVAMITLVVLMLLGVGAMTASNTMFKLAGNVQFENEAKNRAENALNVAEDWLMTGTNSANAGFTTSNPPYYAPNANLDPLTSWPSAASSVAGGSGQFIIERITSNKVIPSGYQTCMPMPACAPTPVPQYYLFRITARGVSSRGATRFVQSIVQIPQN